MRRAAYCTASGWFDLDLSGFVVPRREAGEKVRAYHDRLGRLTWELLEWLTGESLRAVIVYDPDATCTACERTQGADLQAKTDAHASLHAKTAN